MKIISLCVMFWYIIQGKKESFATCLFVCYDLIRPDVALELAWINNIIDLAFPYLLQVIYNMLSYTLYSLLLTLLLSFSMKVMREYTGKVDEIIKDKLEAQKEAKAKEQEEKEVMSQQVTT